MKEPKKITIPDRLYFKISEVSKITGVKPNVRRYWETEFPVLKPTKSKSNQRMYERRDIETVQLIKELLYERRFTIAGAKERLKELRRANRQTRGRLVLKPILATDEAIPIDLAQLQSLRSELKAVLSLLRKESGGPRLNN
ncbi:MAG: MerR family transcriptional regulator [Deltaproteobacteria bacterium]|nr:MerR family transcriptional regulator [Deltaproteobacteria bacterium]